MRVCSEPGCEAKHHAQGRCRPHYRWLTNRGLLDPVPHQTTSERFWSKVDKSGDCWEWIAGLTWYGYGEFFTILEDGRYTMTPAHRYSYETVHGPIPEGLVIDHICHNKACVNPSHLRAVTQGQNMENHSGPTKRNKSGVRGVCWITSRQLWKASTAHAGRHYVVGYFKNLADAEAAVLSKRLELHTHNDKDRTSSMKLVRVNQEVSAA